MAKKSLADIYLDGRVSLDPVPLSTGKKARIKYKGLLSSSGADSIYMHCGYGMGWTDSTEIMMSRGVDGSWSCDFTIDGTDRLNFCFRDSAHNWDNNSGLNWGCDIS